MSRHYHHSGRVLYAAFINYFKLSFLVCWWPALLEVALLGYTYVGVLALVKYFWAAKAGKAWKLGDPAKMSRSFGTWCRKAVMPFRLTPAYGYRRHGYSHTTNVHVTISK